MTKRARQAFLWTYILNTPFWAVYHVLPFILFKELGASAWHITVMMALKPAVSILSVYWSSSVEERPDRLVRNVAWGCLFSHLPFLFFPWIDALWYFIASFALYMLLYRGTIPAWMEILKLNAPASSRQKLFAKASTLSYIGSSLFPFFFGWLMDSYSEAWRWIFPLTALIALSAILLQLCIPPFRAELRPVEEKKSLLHPWKRVWKLICERPDYLRFQVGFMLGGFGLMIMQPAFPEFFMGTLQLNYKEVGAALTLCKGLGYALTSRAWASWMQRVNIFQFTCFVTLLAALFPLSLAAAELHPLWIYIAYLGYGVMQAGSEMSWKLSGPIFSMDRDSSLYSALNVITVGIRGCLAVPMGGLLCYLGGPRVVLFLGFFCCLLAAAHMARSSRLSLAPQGG